MCDYINIGLYIIEQKGYNYYQYAIQNLIKNKTFLVKNIKRKFYL